MTADQPRDAAIEQDIELRDDRTPLPGKPWLVRLTCCGRADGVYAALTWEEADRFRLSYTAPGHYEDVSGLGGGHRRSAVIEDGYAPALAARPDSPTLDEAAIRADERRRVVAEGLLAIPETRAIIERTAQELAALAADTPPSDAPEPPAARSSSEQDYLDSAAEVLADVRRQR